MSEARDQHLDELREIVAEVLEAEPEEITETGSFVEEHEADSLRAIEILAR
ncbi:phosphopantetheine-binding protein, partial [Streptomyces sp. NPDC056159]